MKNLFKPEMFNKILSVLVLLLLLKLLWFIVEILWLPATDIDQELEQGGNSLYYRVKLTPNAGPAPRKTVIKPTKVSGSIRDITLLAIYNASDATVITISHKKKNKVLGLGDDINGFILEGAGNNFATFSKNAKTYRVQLVKIAKNKNNNAIKAAKNILPEPVKDEVKPEGQVTDAGDHKIIDRSLLDHYAKNMDDIYKNMGITEIKEGKNLKGFRISFVKRNSDFSKLGIRRDDVIKSINGQEINSYNAALGVYKNIQNIDNLTLVIQRGKEEMELEYEIN